MADDFTVAMAASLDAAIANGESKQKSLYTQREALKAQIQTLVKQLHDLDKQIDEVETPEMKKARIAKQFLDELNSKQELRPGQMRRMVR